MIVQRFGIMIAAVTLSLASAYGMAPTPVVTLQPPATPFIGNAITFSVTFQNTSTDTTGYAPYIDLVLPATGAEGVFPGTTAATQYDGISFTSANYLLAPVTVTVLTFDASGNVTHPYAKDNTGKFVVINASSFPAPQPKPGDQLVVIQLPFGSFTPTQPPAPLTVTAQVSNLANANFGLSIYARGGFALGQDPLDNPSADPSIIGIAIDSKIVTPTILTATVVNDAPESETATGPNFPHVFTVDVFIAAGQAVTYVNINDVLPPNLQFLSIVSVTPHFPESANPYSIIQQPVAGVAGAPGTPGIPGGTLSVQLTPTIVGGTFTAPANGSSATLKFLAYVPRQDATPAAILDPIGGGNTSVNNATGSINWIPIDFRDPTTVVTSAVATDTLADKPIALQKTNNDLSGAGSSNVVPGDTIQYTLDIEVSDYFAFQNLVVTDMISDGQHLNGVTPTISFTAHGTTSAALPFAAANVKIVVDDVPLGPGPTGKTTLTLKVSAEAAARGLLGGKFVGGGIPDGGTGGGSGPDQKPPDSFPFGPTTIHIAYQTQILNAFTNDYLSGDPSLNSHDKLNNVVNVTGDVLDVATTAGLPIGSAGDGSQSGLEVAPAGLVKSIYAINGAAPVPPLFIFPGDKVTYRLVYQLPIGDVEHLAYKDYLPLPIFHVGDPTADHTNLAWTFDTSAPNVNAPPSGVVKLGPTDTFYAAFHSLPAQPGITPPQPANPTPTVGIELGGSNTLDITFGTLPLLANTLLVSDVLFTVTVGSDPFADNLFLTNQAQSFENSTQVPGTPINDNQIIQIHLGEPGLTPIYKGVVGYNSTGLAFTDGTTTLTFDSPTSGSFGFTGGTLKTPALAAAIGASDLLGGKVDGGDIVRFAVVLQNTGHGDSYNVALMDNYPVGLQQPAAGVNLTLHRGDGTLMTMGAAADYTATTGSSGFTITLNDNFVKALESGKGGIGRGLDPSGAATPDGSNAVVITYDLQVATGATARSTIVNTATLTKYTSTPSPLSSNFVPAGGVSDTAQVEIAKASLAKTLVSTSIVNATDINDNTHAVIGETATFQLVLTVPEGTTSAAQIVDNLPAGLAFSKINSVTLASKVLAANPIGTGAAPGNVTITGAPATGQTLTYNFGDITDSNLDDTVTGTITIVYDTIVMDALGNQDTTPTVLSNSAVFSHTYVDATASTQTFTQGAQSASVTVVEPLLSVTQSVNPSSGPDAGDTLTYTLTIANANSAGDTTAYNLYLNELLPVELTTPIITGITPTGSFTVNGTVRAPLTTDFQFTGNTLSAINTIDIQKNSTLTLTFTAVLTVAVGPGQNINSAATIRWASLPGSPAVLRNGAALTPTAGTNSALDNIILDNYAATTATTTCTILNPQPVKTIVKTSEAHTADPEVAIGEIVRYQLLWQIPEGTSRSLTFTDNLPAGLQFLNDHTAMVGFVSSNGLKLSSSTVSGAGLNISGDQGSIASIHPAFLLDGFISPATFNPGTAPVFSLGDVTNTDLNNAETEYVIIEFNALVANIASNQASAPTSLSNTVTVATTTGSNTSAAIVVNVAEPAITNLTNVVTGTAPSDGKDPITYQVTFSNAGNGTNSAAAFNLHLVYTLDPKLIPPTVGLVNVVAPNLLGFVSTPTVSVSGNIVTVDIDQLYPVAVLTSGPSNITVTIPATVIDAVVAGTKLKSTAVLTYTSLPGPNGTTGNTTGSNTPGASGTATGKRDGSNLISPDNYTQTTSCSTPLAHPLVDLRYKGGAFNNADTSVASSTETALLVPNLVVGESVLVDLLVTLPEGVTNGLVVKEAIPTGLRLDTTFNGTGFLLDTTGFSDPGTLSISTSSTGGLLGANGVGVLFTFAGSPTVSADNVTTNNSFIIEIRLIATDVPGNRIGTTLDLKNTASLTYTDPASGATLVGDSNTANDPKFIVAEPILTVTKTVNPASGDAGDAITYTITISNSSGQTAYDVTVKDVLPVQVNAPAIVGGSVVPAGLAGDFSINPVGNVLQGAGFDLADGASVTLKISGSLSNAVGPGQNITNTAQAFWTSTSGVNGDERTSVDVSNPTLGTIDNSFLNNYAVASTVASTAIAPVVVSKSVIGSSEPSTTGTNVTIGEFATYQITVTVPEGTIDNLRIVDNIPAGQAYLRGSESLSLVCPANVDVHHTGTAGTAFKGTVASLVGSPAPGPGGSFLSGTPVNFDFGQIVNPGDNDPTNNTFCFTYKALVLDVGGNVGVGASPTQLTNTGTSQIVGLGSPAAIYIDPAGTTITVVEPQLSVTQTLSSATADAGDVITFTEVIQHTAVSSSNAFDVTLTDILPAGFTNVSALTCTAGVAPSSKTIGGNTVTVTWDAANDIPLGWTSTITFQATLANTVLPGDILTSTPVITYTSLPGPNHNLCLGDIADNSDKERLSTASVSESVTCNASSVAGLVFHDVGNDGNYDNLVDDTLDGVTVTLTGTDHLHNAVNLTTTTAGGGLYSFTLLRPGTYIITVTTPTGYLGGIVSAGSPPGTPGAPGTNVNNSISLPVETATTGTGYNFAELLQSSLSGFVYDDVNSDKVFVPFPDVGLDGVTVTLTGADDKGAVLVTTTTAGGGAYSFPNLRPGIYTITTTTPAGYYDFYNQIGSQASGSASTPPTLPSTISAIALNQNVNGINNNFGEHQFASVSGFVYFDANNNGTMQAGEFGIPNVTITLTGIDDTGSAVSLTTNSNNAGAFSFTALRPSALAPKSYVLTDFLNPLSYSSGINTPGTSGGSPGSSPDTLSFVLLDGAAASGYLFGKIYVSNPVKSITVPATAPATAQIGDVVRYRLVADLPRGTVKSLEFRDDLPAGMTFVNDGKANVAFVSSGGLHVISSTAVGGAEASDTAYVTPSVALPDTSVSSVSGPTNNDTYGDGVPVFFKFGDVTDTEFDLSPEFVVVEFNARVLDVPSNFRGKALFNTFTVRYDHGSGPADDAKSNSVTVTVIEPTLTVTKASSAVPHHLGYVVPYTITITNVAPSNATAYDVLVTDTLPLDLTLDVSSISVTGAGITTNTSAGNTIALHLNQLAVGGTATVTYNATVTTDITQFGAAITNTVNINWDTQPGAPPVQRSYGASALDTFTITGPGLSLSKTDNVTSCASDDILTYVISVTNPGTDDALNFTVADTLPVNTTFVTASQGVTPVGGVLTWSGQNLAMHQTAPPATYTVTVKVNHFIPSGVTTNFNIVVGTLAPPEIDPNPADNVATDTDVLNGVPDMSIVKTGPATVLPGGVIVYTLTYANVGLQDATGVVISEAVPLRTKFTNAGSTAGWSYSAGAGPGTAGTFNVPGIVKAGTGGVVTIAFVVDAAVPVGFTQIDNTAKITDDGTNGLDPNLLNNTSSFSTHIPTADLLVTKTVDKPKVSKVDVATFTIVVSNAGPDTATNVVVSDPLPNGLKLVSSSPGQGAFNAATGVWTVGTLAKGGSATLTLATNLTIPMPVTNVATITGCDEYDPTPPDNTASATVSPELADLGVVKTVDPAVVSYGANAVYTIVLTNNGPDNATHVLVNDVLPAGLTFVSFTATQGQYSISDGNWTVGSVLNGATATLTITVTALSDTPVDNTVKVVSEDQFDTNPANDTSTVTLTPLHSGLVITKTVDNDVPMMGDTVTFTITVTNSGPGNAPGVQVLDQMPAGLTLGTATPSQGTYDPATFIWTIGTIDNGASPSMTMTATVGSDGLITNTASMVASAATANSVKTSSSATTTTSVSTTTSCFAVSINFARPHRDRLLFTTLCALPKSFNPAGQTVSFSLAGLKYSCTLDRSGQSRIGTHLVQLRPGPKGWVVLLRITNDDLKQVKGVVNENASRMPLSNLVLRVDVGGKTFVSRETRYFTARQNMSGALK